MLHEHTDRPGDILVHICSHPPFAVAQLFIGEHVFPSVLMAYPKLHEHPRTPFELNPHICWQFKIETQLAATEHDAPSEFRAYPVLHEHVLVPGPV